MVANKYAGIYQTRHFCRWAAKHGIEAGTLHRAVFEMMQGLIDADLGSGLFKKRVARVGEGKSGGFRTMVATNRGDRWIFLFGFSKAAQGNITSHELEAFRELSKDLLRLETIELARAIKFGEIMEVPNV